LTSEFLGHPSDPTAIAGLTARTWFTPTRTGHWEIGCSQLCGLGHHRMKGEHQVADRGGKERWQNAEIEREKLQGRQDRR
jgi:cytochrome c oxidase subunit 2